MTRTRQDGGEGPTSAPLIAALESGWAEIRSRHREIGPAVLITGSGSDQRLRNVLRYGHFAASRWRGATEGEGTLPEIFIGGEGLARGPGPVLATLLHEAAHALADARSVKETSRQGRYHNRRFKALAEELGLEIHEQTGIGWSGTTLPEATAARYSATIGALEQAITLYRRHENLGDEQPKSRNSPACLCACPRRIRVAPSVLAAGPIVCSICDQEFAPKEDTDEEEENQ